MSQAASVACPACGAENEVLLPDDSFSDQLTYAALQFACRACGAELKLPSKAGEASAKTSTDS